MKCPDCGHSLSEDDLVQGGCRKCGEPLLPDDHDRLRAELGIAAQAPPEVEAPLIQSEPEDIPDSEECPHCDTPLMGDDLAKWRSGKCPRNECGGENPNPTSSGPTEPVELDPTEVFHPTPNEPTTTSVPTLPMIVNVGPMVGQRIDVPIGEVGRRTLQELLPDPWYTDHLKRVSGEHFELKDDYGIIDLGSTNKTYMAGKEVVPSTIPTMLGDGVDLNIAGNIQLCRCISSFGYSITHEQSGVRVEVEITEIPFHLGRMCLDSDEMEPWARMADLQMRAMDQDESNLSYLSRKHFTINYTRQEFEQDHEDGVKGPKTALRRWTLETEVFEGKEEPEVGSQPSGAETWDAGEDHTINLHKNTFSISSPMNRTPRDRTPRDDSDLVTG